MNHIAYFFTVLHLIAAPGWSDEPISVPSPTILNETETDVIQKENVKLKIVFRKCSPEESRCRNFFQELSRSTDDTIKEDRKNVASTIERSINHEIEDPTKVESSASAFIVTQVQAPLLAGLGLAANVAGIDESALGSTIEDPCPKQQNVVLDAMAPQIRNGLTSQDTTKIQVLWESVVPKDAKELAVLGRKFVSQSGVDIGVAIYCTQSRLSATEIKKCAEKESDCLNQFAQMDVSQPEGIELKSRNEMHCKENRKTCENLAPKSNNACDPERVESLTRTLAPFAQAAGLAFVASQVADNNLSGSTEVTILGADIGASVRSFGFKDVDGRSINYKSADLSVGLPGKTATLNVGSKDSGETLSAGVQRQGDHPFDIQVSGATDGRSGGAAVDFDRVGGAASFDLKKDKYEGSVTIKGKPVPSPSPVASPSSGLIPPTQSRTLQSQASVDFMIDFANPHSIPSFSQVYLARTEKFSALGGLDGLAIKTRFTGSKGGNSSASFSADLEENSARLSMDHRGIKGAQITLSSSASFTEDDGIPIAAQASSLAQLSTNRIEFPLDITLQPGVYATMTATTAEGKLQSTGAGGLTLNVAKGKNEFKTSVGTTGNQDLSLEGQGTYWISDTIHTSMNCRVDFSRDTVNPVYICNLGIAEAF